MAYRNQRGKQWRTRKDFRTVGGIQIGKCDISLGTEDEDEAKKIEIMLEDLRRFGELGGVLLRDITTKARPILDVYAKWRDQTVRDLKAIVGDVGLKEAVDKYLKSVPKRKDGRPVNPTTLYAYGHHLKQVMKLDPNARVSELPKLLAQYREKCVANGNYVAFANTRAACQSFARHYEADAQYSDLWKSIAKIHTVPIQYGKTDIALRVYEARKVIDSLPDPRYRSVAWAMFLTGMSALEYVNNWTVETNHVHVKGTKTEDRDRMVPLLTQLEPQPFKYKYNGFGWLRNDVPGEPPVNYEDFSKAVRVATGGKAGSNVWRHSYRLMLMEAGIPDVRSERYMGHTVKTLKELYAGSDMAKFLMDDTRKLLAYIRDNWNEPKAEEAPVELLKI